MHLETVINLARISTRSSPLYQGQVTVFTRSTLARWPLMNGVSTVVVSTEGDDKQPTSRGFVTLMTSRILPPHDVTNKVHSNELRPPEA